MTTSDQLRKHQAGAAERPAREEIVRHRDHPAYEVGYRRGYHDALEDAIEIAEEEEV